MLGLIVVLDSLGTLTDETTWYDLIFIVAAEMLLYWRIAQHVRDLANSTLHIDPVAEP
jgi:hypothetical protein